MKSKTIFVLFINLFFFGCSRDIPLRYYRVSNQSINKMQVALIKCSIESPPIFISFDSIPSAVQNNLKSAFGESIISNNRGLSFFYANKQVHCNIVKFKIHAICKYYTATAFEFNTIVYPEMLIKGNISEDDYFSDNHLQEEYCYLVYLTDKRVKHLVWSYKNKVLVAIPYSSPVYKSDNISYDKKVIVGFNFYDMKELDWSKLNSKDELNREVELSYKELKSKEKN